jgi:hypothetical protein
MNAGGIALGFISLSASSDRRKHEESISGPLNCRYGDLLQSLALQEATLLAWGLVLLSCTNLLIWACSTTKLNVKNDKRYSQNLEKKILGTVIKPRTSPHTKTFLIMEATIKPAGISEYKPRIEPTMCSAYKNKEVLKINTAEKSSCDSQMSDRDVSNFTC